MDPTPSQNQIRSTVRKCVADSLALNVDEVRPDSSLVADLGANSLDFSSPQVMQDGFLTTATIDKLEGWLPALASTPDAKKITPNGVFSMITVETMCLIVARKLTAR